MRRSIKRSTCIRRNALTKVSVHRGLGADLGPWLTRSAAYARMVQRWPSASRPARDARMSCARTRRPCGQRA
eukprot:1689419-Prymnesium_polylepis.1